MKTSTEFLYCEKYKDSMSCTVYSHEQLSMALFVMHGLQPRPAVHGTLCHAWSTATSSCPWHSMSCMVYSHEQLSIALYVMHGLQPRAAVHGTLCHAWSTATSSCPWHSATPWRVCHWCAVTHVDDLNTTLHNHIHQSLYLINLKHSDA